jgi:hypothetical protein
MWDQSHDVRADLDWWEENNPNMEEWQRYKLKVYRDALEELELEDKHRWECEALDKLQLGKEPRDDAVIHKLQHIEEDLDARRDHLQKAQAARQRMEMSRGQATAFDEITSAIASGVQAKYLVCGGPGTGKS